MVTPIQDRDPGDEQKDASCTANLRIYREDGGKALVEVLDDRSGLRAGALWAAYTLRIVRVFRQPPGLNPWEVDEVFSVEQDIAVAAVNSTSGLFWSLSFVTEKDK